MLAQTCRGMPWTKADESMFGAFRLSTRRLIDDDFWVAQDFCRWPASSAPGISTTSLLAKRIIGQLTAWRPPRRRNHLENATTRAGSRLSTALVDRVIFQLFGLGPLTVLAPIA
jgi:hypothetical protein